MFMTCLNMHMSLNMMRNGNLMRHGYMYCKMYWIDLSACFCFLVQGETSILTLRALHVRSSNLPVFADLQMQTGSCRVQVPQADRFSPVIGQVWSGVGQYEADPAGTEKNDKQHVLVFLLMSGPMRGDWCWCARLFSCGRRSCDTFFVLFCFDLAHLAS